MNLQDILNVEGHAQSEEDYYLSVQRSINAGTWGLQGSFGRAMMDAIDEGACLLGNNPARDYYGNRIPSRFEVKPGTKGSREYVVDARGEQWARLMEGA